MKDFLKTFLRQFLDFTVVLLIICAALGVGAAFLGSGESCMDSIIILAIVLINGIFGAVQEYRAEVILGERANDRPTPLQKKLSETGRWLCVLCIAACAAVFFGSFLRGGALWESLIISVSLAVAAVPEGLPAVVTIMLSAGICSFGKMGIRARTAASAESMGRIDCLFVSRERLRQREICEIERCGIEVFDIREKDRFLKLWEEGKSIGYIGEGTDDDIYMDAADVGGCFEEGKAVYSHAYIVFKHGWGIIEAIKTGRGIYRNLKKTTEYLLSCNMGELFVMLGAVVLGTEAPLLGTQLLIINLITDCLPALAMGFEPYGNEVLKPMSDDEKELLGRKMIKSIIFEGVVIGCVSLVAFLFGRLVYGVDVGRSMAFCVLCFSQLLHGYNFGEGSFFENSMLNLAAAVGVLGVAAIMEISFLRKVFCLGGFGGILWLSVILLSALPFVVFECIKHKKSVAH